jgi:hypothetical protein
MTIADRNELRQPAYGDASGVAWLLPSCATTCGPGPAAASPPARPSRAGFALAIAATVAG